MGNVSANRQVLRLGTRCSELARWQAEWVAEKLRRLGEAVELVEITTRGDVERERPIDEIGTRGVFTKEIQRALVAGDVDLGVHSLKDLPTEAVDGLVIAAVPVRESAADVVVMRSEERGARSEKKGTRSEERGARSEKKGTRSEERGARNEERGARSEKNQGTPFSILDPRSSLLFGARVGTGSLRRQAQLRYWRPDLRVEEVRGNVDTRLRKLDAGQFDAIVLAEAGLRRLGLAGRITEVLPPDVMLPAVGQGALAIECRAEDAETRAAVTPLEDAATRPAVTAERALLAELRGGCMAPVGAWGRIEGGMLQLSAVVLSADGAQRLAANDSAVVEDAELLGRRVAERLLAQGAGALIDAARKR